MTEPPPNSRPPLGITMGCPASIGPEIILRYHDRVGRHLPLPPVIIGDVGILEATADALGCPVAIVPWSAGLRPAEACLNVLEIADLEPLSFSPGCPDVKSGFAMARYIETAIELCLSKSLSGMVTCPIAKTTLNLAGYHFPGHTELLASRTGAERVAMMLAGSRLRVVLATIHLSLATVPQHLSQQGLVELIRLTETALRRDFGIDQARLAVAGLNPHAGEDGLFGDEEKTIIAPAINEARAAGIRVSGPYPPDTIFYQASSGAFDAVVCMYHDQGLIPFKLLHFSDGVNVTLGLPIVRTSVDHGTAYDIAGKGIADYHSLNAAVEMAALIAKNRS